MINNDNISKILLVNKPVGWTSFDIVKKIRGIIKKKYNLQKIKVGHSGTLDPKASGLLIICTGKKTKEMKLFENLGKKYIGIMKIGCVTDSFDTETEEKNKKTYNDISLQDIKDIFRKFIGDQKQTPPVFSAIKIQGERAYKKARRGETEIKLKSRKIRINKLSVIDITPPFIQFEVECSKGTYIRSLVNDIGEKLSCGAYLYSLTRTKIGNFELKKSIDIKDIFKSV